MNSRFAKFLIPAALLSLAACADATGSDSDLPPDAEFGIESADGRADSYGVRPGTPEAEAVLAFANQPLNSAAEGRQFLTLIDTKLHKTAATNIAEYRAGADGSFGTNDDQTFGELKELDAISYVGRVAMMQLYDLAIATGFGQQGEVNCSDYMTPRNGTFVLRTYEDLLVIEQSHCNTIDGQLYIDVRNQYMPTRGRMMASLDEIKTIQGDLQVYADKSFEVIAMRGLTSIGGNILVTTQDRHTLELPLLVNANDMNLQNLEGYALPKLETTRHLSFSTSHPKIFGFDVLRETTDFSIAMRGATGVDVEFPALERVTGRMEISGPDFRRPVTGSFAALTEVRDFHASRLLLENLDLSNLKTVTSSFTIDSVGEPAAPFTGLEVVGGNFAATSLYVPSTRKFVGFNALEAVGGSMRIQFANRTRFEGFDALETIDRPLTVEVNCDNPKFDAFGSLTAVPSINLRVPECEVEGFSVLEEVPGNVTIASSKAMAGFGKLSLIGGAFNFSPSSDQELPSLELVGGNFSVAASGASDISGFNALEVVEAWFTISGTPRNLSGFQALDGVGGNVRFPSRMDRNDVDRVLDQMSQFSGTVTFN